MYLFTIHEDGFYFMLSGEEAYKFTSMKAGDVISIKLDKEKGGDAK